MNELTPFQQATVREIVKRARRARGGLRLALADEVGLGKTHVMSALAQDLSGRGIIMYIAPSLEVAHQNRRRFMKDLGLAEDGNRALESRLTLLPIELREGGRRLVCLTPNTSFQLRGNGNRAERAFLLAIFRILRKRLHLPKFAPVAGHRFSWERVFYRPLGRGDRDYRRDWAFPAWRRSSYLHPAESKKLARSILHNGDIAKLRELTVELMQLTYRSKTSAFKATGRIVSLLRELTAIQVLNDSYRPRLIFFDEWHRYQGLLSGDGRPGHDLLSGALARWKPGSRSAPLLSLFVSATPFEVSFGDTDQPSASIEHLCKLLDPKGDFFKEVELRREAYYASWDQLVEAHSRGQRAEIARAKRLCRQSVEAFSAVLYTRILRTERPSRALRSDPKQDRMLSIGRWEQSDLKSLSAARRLSKRFDSGSDIVGLWHSSTHHLRMPDAYHIARSPGALRLAKRMRLNEFHWKRQRLEHLLKEHWAGRPPLWIPPISSRQKIGKILVFSKWRSVPKELTYFFSDDCRHWRGRKSNTSSPLGAFPLDNPSSKKKQGWRIFYPSLGALDDDPQAFLRWVSTQLNEDARPRRRIAIDWIQVLLGLDLAYLEYREGTPVRRQLGAAVRTRQHLLRIGSSRDWRRMLGSNRATLLKVYRAMSGFKWSELPGWTLLRSLKDAAAPDGLFDPKYQESLLRLGQAANNYFNRPIAQKLLSTARGRRRIYSDTVIAYCISHLWPEMWSEFADLLNMGTAPGEALDAMLESLETRAARQVGAGWIAQPHKARTATIVQPFIETKIAGKKRGEDEEPDTLVTTLRRATFNSPFLPHVLVSTSIGQEGIDLHRYCDTVLHWNPPPSPLALEQREGRVDRFRSYQVRIAERPADDTRPDPWGFSPHFCVINSGARLNTTKSVALRLPHSREAQIWSRCQERLLYFRLFLGAPHASTLEQQLEERLRQLNGRRRAAALRDLSELGVSLSPRIRNDDQ